MNCFKFIFYKIGIVSSAALVSAMFVIGPDRVTGYKVFYQTSKEVLSFSTFPLMFKRRNPQNTKIQTVLSFQNLGAFLCYKALEKEPKIWILDALAFGFWSSFEIRTI